MTHQSRETVLIGGIEKRPIVIADYDALWPKRFQALARSIRRTLGGAALQIDHVGSTSVPGLGAKPIIDILLVVEDSKNEAAYLPPLVAIGYELRVREPDFHEHRMFRTSARDVHVHVYSVACPEIERVLAFRDHLRSNPRDRQLYEETKRRLASQPWPDMNSYAEAKTEVIEQIIANARTEKVRPTEGNQPCSPARSRDATAGDLRS